MGKMQRGGCETRPGDGQNGIRRWSNVEVSAGVCEIGARQAGKTAVPSGHGQAPGRTRGLGMANRDEHPGGIGIGFCGIPARDVPEAPATRLMQTCRQVPCPDRFTEAG